MQILEELAAGNYITVKKKPKIVSALGAVYKSDGNVQDYSQPFESRSLNGWYQAETDLRLTYIVVDIKPAHCDFTGCKWRFKGETADTYMVDTRLSFGTRKSLIIFHRLTQAVKRMMHWLGTMQLWRFSTLLTLLNIQKLYG